MTKFVFLIALNAVSFQLVNHEPSAKWRKQEIRP